MKIHYINILLFALPLNILVNNQRNHNNSTYHTSNTKTIKSHRSLCECKLYAQSNYENDQEMKDVIKEFNDRTAQRFEEYNERMQVKKNQCKEQCDKEIQQIILKDKIEKELTERFSALETKIDTNDILTCICEKSVADKVEKTCVKCGRILGTAVPELSLIGGIAVYAAAQSATMKTFISETIDVLNRIGGMSQLFGAKISQFVTPSIYGKPMTLVTTILSEKEKLCLCVANKKKLLCGGIERSFEQNLPARIAYAVNQGVHTANETWATATTPTTFLTNPFVASSIAIMIIVAIVLIIYLILRYRRKQKIKKKIQYIKLL
ncbi:rifin [Plasmodium falciparum NF54]|uniref:Rifin n=2 Tax=Plasmodium falciparum TaxID=5833 RepID=O97328_PLAF7|nr:rifin [Plasmodium falciparum 3D7]KAF4328802.1 rifin [Plasmodium falciparum NF54]PKC45502.1 rifin [Plasmodium falciparum NF54]CAB39120.1 rifin [Plasmodium falciparum 3D7]|eukprot:XP_001351085.1 rifin [Plasmodium falciparum 3D7]